jgi:hypothetical protein
VATEQSNKLEVSASGGSRRFKWALSATGKPAQYVAPLAAVLLSLYLCGETMPTAYVIAITAMGVLGMRLGVDFAGSQVRRLEEEIGRHVKEIERLVEERNRLQAKLISKPQSSANRKKRQ